MWSGVFLIDLGRYSYLLVQLLLGLLVILDTTITVIVVDIRSGTYLTIP